MECLPLVRLVDAHVGIVAALAHVDHMAKQVPTGVLRPCVAQVHAQPVKRGGADRERPFPDRQGAHQHHTAAFDELPMNRLEPRGERRQIEAIAANRSNVGAFIETAPRGLLNLADFFVGQPYLPIAG